MIEHSRPTLGKAEMERLRSVLDSGYISEGKYVKCLESELRDYIGAGFSIATNCGTSALHLLLLCLNVSKGDKVILPSYVCSSVLNSIMYVGAEPVICDIEADSFNLSLQDVKKKINDETKAVILPYIFGCPAPVDKFLELGIPIVEDCAQGLGASYNGRRLGGFGCASIFSFYATKVITTGQGGMILTNSKKISDKARDLIEYDNRHNYITRYNYKMTDIQAALGLAQFSRLGSFIRRRKQIAKFYDKLLSKCGILIPLKDPGHIYYRYVIRIKPNQGRFIQRLTKKGIEAKPAVFRPLHRYLGLSKKSFPNSEEVFKTTVSLPIYPGLSDKQAGYIAEAVMDSL